MQADYTFYLKTNIDNVALSIVAKDFDRVYLGITKQEIKQALDSYNFDGLFHQTETKIYRELTISEEVHFRRAVITRVKKMFRYKENKINAFK